MNNKLSKNWVRGSVFYERRSWHRLLSEAIFPFLNKTTYLIETYTMQLCIAPRDHIKIALRSASAQSAELEERFLEYMDIYLLSNPSETVEVGYKFYPNNTAWTNQYNERDFYLMTDKRDFSFIRKSIALSFKMLSADVIDMSGAYSFILYMQLGIIRAIYSLDEVSEKIKGTITFLKTQYNDRSKFINATSEKAALRFLSANRRMLIKAAEDVWSDCLYIDDELKWLKEWIEACVFFIRNTNNDYNEFFILISRLIYDSLGLANVKLLPMSLLIFTDIFNEIDKNRYHQEVVV